MKKYHTFETGKANLLLNIPETIKTHESALSTMWFDEDGIFCSVTKKNSILDKKNLIETFDFIRQNAGGKKICWLSNVTDIPPPEKAARDYAAEESPKLIKALALITNSSLSKMIAEIFMLVKKPPYPTKMFTGETEAREWLKKFCDQ